MEHTEATRRRRQKKKHLDWIIQGVTPRTGSSGVEHGGEATTPGFRLCTLHSDIHCTTVPWHCMPPSVSTRGSGPCPYPIGTSRDLGPKEKEEWQEDTE